MKPNLYVSWNVLSWLHQKIRTHISSFVLWKLRSEFICGSQRTFVCLQCATPPLYAPTLASSPVARNILQSGYRARESSLYMEYVDIFYIDSIFLKCFPQHWICYSHYQHHHCQPKCTYSQTEKIPKPAGAGMKVIWICPNIYLALDCLLILIRVHQVQCRAPRDTKYH